MISGKVLFVSSLGQRLPAQHQLSWLFSGEGDLPQRFYSHFSGDFGLGREAAERERKKKKKHTEAQNLARFQHEVLPLCPRQCVLNLTSAEKK